MCPGSMAALFTKHPHAVDTFHPIADVMLISDTTILDGMATVILPRNPLVAKTLISFGAPSVAGATTHAKFSDAQRRNMRQTTAAERNAPPPCEAYREAAAVAD